MSHKLRRGLIVLAAALVLFGALATSAHANLDSEPVDGIHGTTSSNPGAGADYWWRMGWGQSLYPDFALAPPEGMDHLVDGYIIGMLYSVDQNYSACASGAAGIAVINPATPSAYYRSSIGGTTDNTGPYGTNTDYTIDMLGVYANRLGGPWPPSDPGATQPVEGQWYLHYRYFSSVRYSEAVHTIAFGIDTTPPNPVTGLRIRTGLNEGSDVTTWQPFVRAHITWTPAEYDALSRVGYYQVLVDDKPLIPETSKLPVQGRVYSMPGYPTPDSITVENMPPGKHKVSIVCVDRATNESTATSGYYYSDPDTPTVSFTAPLTGYLKDTTYISVDASDAAGAPTVKVALDGVDIAAFSAPPYRFKPNLTGVVPGAHTLTATATDHMGRSVTTTLAVSTLGSTVIPTNGYIVTDDELMNAALAWKTDTNPNDALSTDSFWRQGWGKSLNPQFVVTPPTPDSSQFGFVAGTRYLVDRSPNTEIDPTGVVPSYQSALISGTHLDHSLDLMGIFNNPPTGGWPTSMIGGETQAFEGYWYLHVLPYTTLAYVPENSTTIQFGIDVTPPHPVTGLVASPNLDRSGAGVWTAASRANVTWDADRYDDLSGVAYYQVLVDDAPVIPSGTDDTQGRLYEVLGRTSTSVTIENMPAGKHKISVVAVDRATNESPAGSTYFYSDPDAPAIVFGSFAHTVGVTPSFFVTATDAGGIKQVEYRLDGTLLGTQTQSPFSISPNLSAFSSGSHTLTATAMDQFGRTATVSTTITLDKTPLSLSKFTRSPAIFYPIKRDKYKDNSTLKFQLNKPASVSLAIMRSNGKTVRTITKNGVVGTNTMTWDGKWATGKAHTGKFTYQLTATDGIGNSKKSNKLTTTIRNYQLVRKSNGSVKVIAR